MNITNDQGQQYPLPQADGDHAVQMALSLIGIVANFLLINAHIKDPFKILKTSSSLFILNIAAIDLSMSFTYFIHSLTTLTISDLGQNQSQNLYGAITLVLNVFMSRSFSSFLSLSIERFCSVAFPLWHRVRITARVRRYWLGTLWLVHFSLEALNVSLMLLLGDGIEMESGITRFVYMSLTFFLTQLFYLGTYFSLKKQRRELLAYQDVGGVTCRALKLRLENEKNFLFTVAIVCSIQAAIILPILSYILLYSFLFPNRLTKHTNYVFRWIFMILLCINYAVNPFVYLWRFPRYKKTFKKLYCN